MEYVLAGLVVILAVATVYSATRKPKMKTATAKTQTPNPT
jgi:hypothetical protein